MVCYVLSIYQGRHPDLIKYQNGRGKSTPIWSNTRWVGERALRFVQIPDSHVGRGFTQNLNLSTTTFLVMISEKSQNRNKYSITYYMIYMWDMYNFHK